MNIKENISLKKYNTFGIDVTARFFSEIFSEEELSELLLSDKIKPLDKLMLGGGSNVLLTHNYDGIVIKISIPGISIINDERDFVLV